MIMTRVWIGLCAVLFLCRVVSAQTVSYDVGYFMAGVDPATSPTAAPFKTDNVVVTSVSCGQPKIAVVTGTVINPTELRFDDEADATKDCVVTTSTTLLTALPFGTGYKVGLKRKSATDASAWSVLSNPFDRAAPLAAPTNVRVRRP